MINTFYLVIAVALMLAFFRTARLLGLRNKIIQKISPVLSLLELVLWTIIIFWSVGIFLSTRSYYPHLVIILAILFTLMITWFYLKDIVAGFVFRVRHNPVKGQILTCESIHGSLRTLGLSQLTVETDGGRRIRVPYSLVVTRSLSLQSPRHIVPGETTLELTVEKVENPGNMERTVKKILAQSPWCIASKPITIQFIPEENKIKIAFFLLNPVYLQAVKDRLANSLKE
jgi:hypothetical protein